MSRRNERTNTGVTSPSRAVVRAVSTSPSRASSAVSPLVQTLRAGGDKALTAFVDKARRMRNDGTLAGRGKEKVARITWREFLLTLRACGSERAWRGGGLNNRAAE